MGSMRRVWQPEIFYHVTMRGNNRQNIFINKADFALFFQAMQYTHEKYPFTIIAYCMMNNHYHLLIRSPEVPLSNVMTIINKRYSDYFKRKYNFFDQLYETRFYANMVTDPISLLNVSSYIHQNPLRTTNALVNKMEVYPHSSYQYYVNQSKSQPSFINTQLLPSIIEQYPEIVAESYSAYCENFRMEEEKSPLILT
ncbi:transposase [Psychrobacillus sp. OK032]|uniref:transposase n=1 Tax=Psychrobacillus sp. OK032 TaxID=1884358 RepID=UPI0008C5218B|nr:transposase [Psychrobacillus sp. OK032]SER66793.1 REP element-mobilizing transposase RayT [Psychrobacillus sp. OK032]